MSAPIPTRPRFATLARDGWALVDAERAYRVRDGVYWVPPAAERFGLRRGMLARLLFAWAEPDPDDPGRERLWVEVERALRRGDGAFLGRLLAEPAANAPVGEGALVWARPEHVLDVAERGGRPLSERSDLVPCEGHGWSEPCLVCAHLPRGEGLGFHEGAADPGRLRPDAWCDACHALLARAARRGAVEPRPPAKLVCGGCYDRFRDRNLRRP
jgi:hypothetical protein